MRTQASSNEWLTVSGGAPGACVRRARARARHAGRSRDEALGPVRIRTNGRFAKGDLSQLDAHPRIPMSMLPVIAMLFFAWLRGESAPPFFETGEGEFRVVPQVLSEAELRQVTTSAASQS